MKINASYTYDIGYEGYGIIKCLHYYERFAIVCFVDKDSEQKSLLIPSEGGIEEVIKMQELMNERFNHLNRRTHSFDILDREGTNVISGLGLSRSLISDHDQRVQYDHKIIDFLNNF